jgi:aromatic-L-amino-acid decarboxylase
METARFAELLARIGKGLDEFVEFDHPDAVATRGRWDALADEEVPDVGLGVDQVADELLQVVIPGGTRIPDPGFWGFITTGTTTAPVLAATAAMVAAPQRGMITAFNRLEERALEMLGQLCGLEPHMKGVFVSSGSVANLIALGAARQFAFEQVGHDPAAHGVDRPTAIYASSEVHHTVHRAAAVLGLGRSSVRSVPTDARQRMDVAALEALITDDRRNGMLPVCVVATAGTTNTGAIDPLRAAGEVARSHGIWFHVDGAYGLPGILDERVADRFDGLQLADSAIVDPHKWLAAPTGIASAFVRDRDLLVRAFTQEPAAYLEGSFATDGKVVMSADSIGIPYADMAVELSSPPRGITVWSILREQGMDGLRSRIRQDNDYARRVAEFATNHPRLENLTEPELSVACFRYVGDGIADLDDFNNRLMRRLWRETRWTPSATRVGGVFALRPCFINPRTQPSHVEDFLSAVVRLGDEMAVV